MNNKIAGFISTSVTDAQIDLNGILAKNPAEAKAIAEGIVEKLKNSEGQVSRIKLANTIIRKADKKLKASVN